MRPYPVPTSRRRFVQGLAAGGVVTAAGLAPSRGLTREPAVPAMPELSGTRSHLTIGQSMVNFTGRTRPAITVNGSLPAPLLRWREGTTVTLHVTNALPRGRAHGDHASIHWHGIRRAPTGTTATRASRSRRDCMGRWSSIRPDPNPSATSATTW
jgi:FtsP/CotA-like multicopper oxidase with cupredoxin domain